MRTRKRGLLLLVGLGVVVGLPLLGHWARSGSARRCALDGVAIDPLFAARVVDEAGREQRFCCIDCARRWLRRQQSPPRAVFVTDEMTGEEIDVRSAWLVRSQVVSVAATQNRVHAFGRRDDAERHARAAWGRVLTGDENPFAGLGAGTARATKPFPERER